jgi:predicted TPR repeat methyltransferase
MRADPVTQFVPDDDIVGFLGDLEEVIADVAKDLPDHGEFVRRLPSSTAAAPTSVSFNLRYERGETVQ